ncbi:MAG: peptide chain release factor N(5)-glutamine methyltransferase [Chloroflexota bacterium]|nr:peptide chain release factor N(5)-glutamine methyltransferase [Chloroflexota bacterium]
MSSSASNVAALLRAGSQTLDGAGSETPRLDAELLLGHVLGVGRATLLAEGDSVVSAGQQETFQRLIERRASGVPVAYLRGLKEFYGLALSVDERALIPRPETETLVGLALDRIAARLTDAPRPADARPLLVWDVGTGSGAICVALAVECRRRGYAGDVAFQASDHSSDALAVATENAVAHGVADAIEFAQADLTDIPGAERADLLVANLPYVPTYVVPTLPVAASFEPRVALDGGADGLAIIRRLLAQLPHAVADDGLALLEIGADQGDPLGAAAGRLLPGWALTIHDDLAGRPRVAELTRDQGA